MKCLLDALIVGSNYLVLKSILLDALAGKGRG